MNKAISKLELIASLITEEVKSVGEYIAYLESKNDVLELKEEIARLEKELKEKTLEVRRLNKTNKELSQKLMECSELPGQEQFVQSQPVQPALMFDKKGE